MWDAHLDLFPGRTIAPTLYGFGPSLEDWAHGVLDLVGDAPFVVVGCSVGGSCALEVASLAAPGQVSGVVLVGAKAGVRPDPRLRDSAIDVLRRRGLSAAWDAYWRPLFGRSTPVDVVASARALALDQDVDDIIRGVRAFHDRRDLTGFAHSWPGPIVIISGDQDRTPSPSAAALPGRPFHLVEDCGHYVSLERPASFRTLLTRAAKKMGTSL
jgi:pimeloyl-ACP methyl ester carboxylesterase